MPPPDGLSGGKGLEDYLAKIAESASNAQTVRVGFLEGSTYPDGTSVPMIAATMEWGGRIEREPQESMTIYRKINEFGEFQHNGQFVRKEKSNYATDHYVGAYVITIPPRPFFRTMIADKSGEWGNDLGKILEKNDYNAQQALGLMGERIAGQLRESIVALVDPPLAKSTIKAKGSAKPLVETSHMLQSVDYEVTGEGEPS